MQLLLYLACDLSHMRACANLTSHTYPFPTIQLTSFLQWCVLRVESLMKVFLLLLIPIILV